MNKSSPSLFFKGLNKKIIAYFIAFAFVPLLIFSILGYYLNKDMITGINRDNLFIVNKNFAEKIELYYSQKTKLLQSAVLLNNKSLSKELLVNEFVAVTNDSLNGLENFLYNSGNNKNLEVLPGISFVNNQGELYRGYLDVNEIQQLLKCDIKKISHFLYFHNEQKIISDNGFGKIEDSDKIYNDLLDKKNKTGMISSEGETGLISSYIHLKKPDIFVVTQMDAKIFYSKLIDFRNRIFFANFVIAIILVGLAILYSRRITKPIHKLIFAVQQIGKGKLDAPVKLETNDEIQILANEFEFMRSKLQESYHGLEEKIESRTKELQQAQAQITHQEKMASLGLMAAGIAHEIGNPLTSISSMAQLIKRINDDPKINDYVCHILKNIDRISRIVRELVDFSRPSSYETSLNDVNEIVNSAVGIVKYDRRSKNIKYNLDLDQNLPKTFLVADHLLQVFLNILINAVDASEGYGNTIQVDSRSNSKFLKVDISDEGCGIEANKLNKIFEPFYTTKEIGKGTGLGLTVSYGIIKQLDGEIKANSVQGKGSTFSIIIPIVKEIKEKDEKQHFNS